MITIFDRYRYSTTLKNRISQVPPNWFLFNLAKEIFGKIVCKHFISHFTITSLVLYTGTVYPDTCPTVNRRLLVSV